jgi:hypothetical protein
MRVQTHQLDFGKFMPPNQFLNAFLNVGMERVRPLNLWLHRRRINREPQYTKNLDFLRLRVLTGRLKSLEPSTGKLVCTVLRGERLRKENALPDTPEWKESRLSVSSMIQITIQITNLFILLLYEADLTFARRAYVFHIQRGTYMLPLLAHWFEEACVAKREGFSGCV